jgi:hypothetical protein
MKQGDDEDSKSVEQNTNVGDNTHYWTKLKRYLHKKKKTEVRQKKCNL